MGAEQTILCLVQVKGWAGEEAHDASVSRSTEGGGGGPPHDLKHEEVWCLLR